MLATPTGAEGAAAAPPRELALTTVIDQRQLLLWPEAVAIVAELVDAALTPDDHPGFPVADDVVLRPNGSLVVTHEQRGRGARASHARQMLAELLAETPTPAPLEAVVNDTLADADDLARFSAALHPFVRPNRSAELASAFRRIDAVVHADCVDQQLADVVAHAQQARADRDSGRPSGAWWHTLKARASSLVWLAPFASVVVVVVALAIPWVSVRGGPERDGGRSTPRLPDMPTALGPPSAGPIVVPSIGRNEWRAPGYATKAGFLQGPRAKASATPPPGPRAAGMDGGDQVAGSGSAVEPALSEGVPAFKAPGLDGVGILAPPLYASRPPAVVAPSPAEVFTPDSPGVTPPVLLSQLPDPVSGGASTPAVEAVLDLLVNEHGSVERVALVSDQGHQERLLVWAAKAWVFRPATRAGVPVRYRARIRVPL